MSVAALTRYTADDLLHMPDGKGYELVDGELVELKMSQESSWIAGRIHRRLSEFGEDNGLGWAFPEGTGFQCFREDRNRVRKPDASFVLKSRLLGGPSSKGYGRIVPDFIVEVVSPDDLVWEVETKIEDWLAAGVRVAWEVRPSSRTVIAHRPDSEIEKFSAADELTLPELLPAFRVQVVDLFPPKSAAAAE